MDEYGVKSLIRVGWLGGCCADKYGAGIPGEGQGESIGRWTEGPGGGCELGQGSHESLETRKVSHGHDCPLTMTSITDKCALDRKRS